MLGVHKLFKSDSARVAFYYALVLVVKVLCGGFSIPSLIP
nr:DUF3265 domain-containing protein [Aeromonas sp. Y311-2]